MSDGAQGGEADDGQGGGETAVRPPQIHAPPSESLVWKAWLSASHAAP